MSEITYKEAGVNIDAGEELVDRIKPAVASTMRPEVLSNVGGFASLVSLPTNYKNPVLVSGTDGVGTKLKIAFELNDHSTVGIDLVAMCANDVLAVGAEPLFFLDYYACSDLEPEAGTQVIEGIAEGCRQAGAALVGGETAEMPGFYKKGEYDLAGFVVGVAERDNLITGEKVSLGDAVIGIGSSGVHSNGFSLVRRIVEKAGISFKDTPKGLDKPIGEVLLTPTKIYAKPVLKLAKALEVRSVAHITGGGLLENIQRSLPKELGVHLNAQWPVPLIFKWLQENGPVAPKEMYRTFNMGVGMTVVVAKQDADKAVELLTGEGEQACVVGEIIATPEGTPRISVTGI